MSVTRKAAIAAALLVALTAAAILPVLHNGFINYDDPQYVLENRHVRTGLTLEAVAWALTTFHASNWHPLTWVVHQLNVTLWGLDPFGHHLTSFMLHLANAVLVLAALRALTGLLWPSFLVAALFAVHPLHVESVAWVAELKDVLSSFFGLLTLLAYLRFLSRPEPSRYAVTVLLFAAGLLAKPMLVTLPLVFLILDWWPLDRWRMPGTTRRILREKLPLLALSVLSSLVTYRAQGEAVGTIVEYSLAVRTGNAMVSYVRYLEQAFWPALLAPFYPHPGDTLPLWQTGAALLFLLGLGWALFVARRARPYFLAGGLFYLIMLLPVIGLIQVGGQAMADRYTYLPLLGPFVAVVWSLRDLPLGRMERRTVTTAAALLLIPLAVTANRQARLWRDSITLFSHAHDVTRDNWLAHNNLASALDAAGRLDEAAGHYRESLRINPGFAKAYYGLGAVRARQGKLEEAKVRFMQALRYEPRSADALYNLGSVYADEGRLDEAAASYRKSLEINPELPEGWNGLGIVLARMERLDEATDAFRRAVALNPGYAEAHYNLGRSLSGTGRAADAATQFELVLRLNPRDAEAHYALGMILLSLGRGDEALGRLREALRLDPSSPQFGAAEAEAQRRERASASPTAR